MRKRKIANESGNRYEDYEQEYLLEKGIINPDEINEARLISKIIISRPQLINLFKDKLNY